MPADIASEPVLAALWPRLRETARRTLAWGDLGKLRPPETEITPGWHSELDATEFPFEHGELVELVTVCGQVRTFRPVGTVGWYVRPMTIFEARALANTLLHVLDLTAGNAHELRLYFDACYGERASELEPDYLYLFDLMSRIMGPSSFAAALATENAAQIGTLLRLVSGVCWFALQAPPVSGDSTLGPASSSVTMRLFTALAQLRPQMRRLGQIRSVAQLCQSLEETDLFKGMEQAPIREALTESERALLYLDEIVESVWNPDVRTWFKHLIGLMRPYFTGREARYDSLLGMPNDGNTILGVREEHEWEAIYDDHMPRGDAAEWLELRRTLLFSYHLPQITSDFVNKLDNHFQAMRVMWFCRSCDGLHGDWISRFAEDVDLICPVTGAKEALSREDLTIVNMERPSDVE
jgi:hypothetical protein